MSGIDQVQLNFNPETLSALNWILALVMFGVALDLRIADFRRVLQAPWAPMVGLACQFLFMPAIATGIVYIVRPEPSIALGIILIAACPGGNMSNFLTSLGRGNAALSVSMSAISTMASILMTPFNFLFWGAANPHTAPLLQRISLSPLDIFLTVLTILVLPTVAGMSVARIRPRWAARLHRPMRAFSVLVLLAFIVGAIVGNAGHFVDYVGAAFWIVLIVNATGLCLGYGLARLARLDPHNARAVSFETGIQNSGFGLILCFNFFGGLGGMAIIAAWWGVWHLITGLSLATWWSRRDPEAPSPADALGQAE